VNHAGVTRSRPAFKAGWEAEFQLMVITPEYISRDDLQSCLTDAGKRVGMAEIRPTYGRFQIVSYSVGLAE
jgi:hypothetical protein